MVDGLFQGHYSCIHERTLNNDQKGYSHDKNNFYQKRNVDMWRECKRQWCKPLWSVARTRRNLATMDHFVASTGRGGINSNANDESASQTPHNVSLMNCI